MTATLLTRSQAEIATLWLIRRITIGADVDRRAWPEADALLAFLHALDKGARRRLTFLSGGGRTASFDEVSILGLLRAARSGAERLFDVRAETMCKPDARPALMEAARQYHEATCASGRALPAPDGDNAPPEDDIEVWRPTNAPTEPVFNRHTLTRV